MIGPEMHQAFGKGASAECGALRACQHLCAVMRLISFANHVEGFRIRGLTSRFTRRQQSCEYLVGSRQWRGGAPRIDSERCRALDLRHQPGAGIAGSRLKLPGSGAQSKTQRGNFSLHIPLTA